MSETVIPVSGNISGDITACKIETVKDHISRKGALALKQDEHYIAYDVCTKKVINQYTTTSFTDITVLTFIITMLSLTFVFIAWLDTRSSGF